MWLVTAAHTDHQHIITLDKMANNFNFLTNFVRKITEIKYLISFGFVVSFGMLVLVIQLGIQQLNQTHDHIQSIVDKQNVKTELISQMIWAARERSLNLYHIVSITDEFERDDIYMAYHANAARFGHARTQLVTMKLTAQEKQILAEQSRYTRLTVPIQEMVIDLVNDDEILQAYKLLVQKAVPYQNKVLGSLKQLTDLQQQSAQKIAEQSKQHVSETNALIQFIGFLAIILSIAVAYIVTRRALLSERTLQLEKDLAKVTLHSIGDAVITTNPDGIITDMNPVAEELTGWNKVLAIRTPLEKILKLHSEHTNDELTNPLIDAIKNSHVVFSEQDAKLLRRDNHEFSIEYTAAPISDSDNELHGGIIIFRDVTPMRTMAYQLSYQASHDALTGLLNRREFETRLEQAIGNARTEHQSHVLCYLDLDQFKIINDTCGHIAGDELLKQISMRLKSKLRESDIIARLGGDEFGVLLEGCSIEMAATIAEQLREVIKEVRFVWDDKSFDTGVSIGVVPINNTSSNVSDVLSAADTACYEAKDQGRNRIHIYTIDDDSLTKRRGEMQWVHRITDALDNDKFVLYCQKIIPLDDTVTNDEYYELLVRIRNEDNTLVMPMAFIPAAERYNLMPVIDKVVIEKALTELQILTSGTNRVHFSINISGQTLCENSFLSHVIDTFEKTGIDPDQIIFEITETAAIANFTQAIHFIQTLKDVGCQFALDDFGSGLSSFAYLKNIPVDYLKIDGYFIRDIIDDPTDSAFVESIHQIGSVMGIKTIAEYVENEAILAKLRTIGVNFAQGYHIGRPHPLGELLEHNASKVTSSIG